MLNRAWIAAALFAAQMAAASPYDYEFSPVVGIDFPEGNLMLENELIIGGEFQFNHLFESAIKPEISVYYTDVDYKNGSESGSSGGTSGSISLLSPASGDATASTKIWRVGVGGVYDYKMTHSVIPFAKAGLGYENMSDTLYDNTNSLYADTGLGIKFPVTDMIALKLEAIYMLKVNDNRYDNNLMALAGLSFAFGGGAAPAAAASKGYATYDSDKDGVVDNDDQCPNTPAGVDVDAFGCPFDSDKDGVANINDKCPGTPAGFRVDADGCEKTFPFSVEFAIDSAIVTAADMKEIEDFVAFMKANEFKATIVGRADSTGPSAYNDVLSKKRAEVVMNLLVQKGIGADRLTAVGKGESDPVASNETEEGRAQNRSVRAELIR